MAKEQETPKSLRDRFYPARTAQPSCIRLPAVQGNNFELKSQFITMLPHFHGLPSEDAYLFLREFEEVCVLIKMQQLSDDAVKLRFITFSLKDGAKKWLYGLPTNSITTWEEFTVAFLKKFFPMHKTNKLRNDILQFRQKPHESFSKFMERFKDLLQECPHHGLDTWHLCQIIYEGIDYQTKQLLESMCPTGFTSYTDENDAWNFLIELAEKTREWESTQESERAIGKGFIEGTVAKEAHLDILIKRLEAIVVKGPSQVNQLNAMQPNLPQQEPSDHCNAVFALRSGREYQREEGRSEPSKDAQESPIKVSKESSSIGSEEEPEQMVAKYKDPGCPTIACTIGNTHINHALLDLGASVNLLPLSVFKQLGLGELKPTTVTLQLADRSMKKPKGMVEDVLVKVGEFLFPVDFIVLETEPVANIKDQIPIILGRPFLATSNALIDCRNGLMKLTFGNASMDFNVFRLGFEEALDEEGLENVRDIGDSFSDDLSIQQIEFGASLSPSLPKPPPKKAPQLNLPPLHSNLRKAYLGLFMDFPNKWS
ncbi:uncharacterized protein LOC143880732 [Tasmannia lanceolata]|uniref:uncharacterized protein LOC143857100 n=1 Tax=Tasmannia lanceolata TaxID=3420 RepID=UPI004063C3D5